MSKEYVKLYKDGTVFKYNLNGYVNEFAVGSGSPGSVDWGDIGGTLSAQSDLGSALAGKSDTDHTHVEDDITDLSHIDSTALHTKSDVEGVLVGEISSHTHAGGGGLSQAQVLCLASRGPF